MSKKTNFLITLTKIAATVVVSGFLFVIVVNAMKNPVSGETHSYFAEFTDVAGLGVNGDIRTKGVRIGKVESVDLVRDGDQAIAQVRFTMEDAYRLTADTTLAVKYQNLTGVRYIDVEFPSIRSESVDRLSTTQTKSSFDITQLFNGLQPVLATMSTDEVNRFTENAIALLQGDGNGLTPMLEDAQTLANLAHDREQVISTLTDNLSRISESMGGKSPQVIEFLKSVSFPIAKAMTVLDEFPKTATFGPEFLTPVKRLIDGLGIYPGMDVEKLVSDALASMPDTTETLRLFPSALAGLRLSGASPQSSGALACERGVANLPREVEILIDGSEVVVCNS